MEEAGNAAAPSAVHKSLQVLKALTEPGPHRVSTLVKSSGLNKATVIRILDMLEDEGFVVRTADRAIQFGPEAFVLAASANRRPQPYAGARASLARLAADSGDCALLLVPSGAHMVCVDREEGTYPMRAGFVVPGRRLPMGAGSPGVAFLAALPEREAEERLSANAARLSGMGRLELERIREAVIAARTCGYAIVTNVVSEGTGGISVAVRGAGGRPVAVLSVAALANRLHSREAMLAAMLLREEPVIRSALGAAD